MKAVSPTFLDSLTPRVMEAYINSMLQDIDEDGTDEDGTLPAFFTVVVVHLLSKPSSLLVNNFRPAP
jgi:hypothetical protein